MIYNDTVNLNGIKQDLYFDGKFNAGTFQQNDLNRIINKYYLQAQTAIRGVNEDFYAVATKTNLTAGTNVQYSWPTDYEKIKYIEIAVLPANLASPTRGEYVRAIIVTSDQITNPSFVFSQPTIVVYGDYFEVINTVANTVTNGIRMIYIPKQAQMVSDSDSPNIFEDYHDVIMWGSLIDIAPRLNNAELESKAEKMFIKRMKDLTDNASARIQNMAGEYVEGQTNSDNLDFPWGNTGGYW